DADDEPYQEQCDTVHIGHIKLHPASDPAVMPPSTRMIAPVVKREVALARCGTIGAGFVQLIIDEFDAALRSQGVGRALTHALVYRDGVLGYAPSEILDRTRDLGRHSSTSRLTDFNPGVQGSSPWRPLRSCLANRHPTKQVHVMSHSGDRIQGAAAT